MGDVPHAGITDAARFKPLTATPGLSRLPDLHLNLSCTDQWLQRIRTAAGTQVQSLHPSCIVLTQHIPQEPAPSISADNLLSRIGKLQALNTSVLNHRSDDDSHTQRHADTEMPCTHADDCRTKDTSSAPPIPPTVDPLAAYRCRGGEVQVPMLPARQPASSGWSSSRSSSRSFVMTPVSGATTAELIASTHRMVRDCGHELATMSTEQQLQVVRSGSEGTESQDAVVSAASMDAVAAGLVRTQMEGVVSNEVQDSIKAGLVRTQMEGVVSNEVQGSIKAGLVRTQMDSADHDRSKLPRDPSAMSGNSDMIKMKEVR